MLIGCGEGYQMFPPKLLKNEETDRRDLLSMTSAREDVVAQWTDVHVRGEERMNRSCILLIQILT